MELTVEINRRMFVEQEFLIGRRTSVMVTPPIDENYWIFRVPVSAQQAVVAFPKFCVIGIGFQHEEDWNTNLPSSCGAEKIFAHIAHNKGDASIPDTRCIEAIQLLQETIYLFEGEGP